MFVVRWGLLGSWRAWADSVVTHETMLGGET